MAMESAKLFMSQKTVKEVLGALASALIFVSCAKSPLPSVTELIPLHPPTFDSLSSKSFVIASPDTTINGECDLLSRGLQYSYDQTNWVDFADNCLKGTFSISVHVNPYKDVYVRAKTKSGHTPAAHAFVHHVLPPTSTAATFVLSSRSDQTETRGTQNAIGYTFTGIPSANGSAKLDLHVVGVAYDE
jgi:hypothetical protein